MFGQTVENATSKSMPRMAASIRVSERAGLIAAGAPKIAFASSQQSIHEEIKHLKSHYEDMLMSLASLKTPVSSDNFDTLLKNSRLVWTLTQEIKTISLKRLRLSKLKRTIMQDVHNLQNSMDDIIPPIVYGITSYTRLMSNRTALQITNQLKQAYE